MKLPISVLMYQVSDDYDYETVNVDVSSAYDGIKLFDESVSFQNSDDENYLYFISEDHLVNCHHDLTYTKILSASVFVCLCSSPDCAARTQCSDLSVVFMYATDKFAFIFNRLQNTFKRFETWEKSFHLSILKKATMQELIDLTEEFMTHPVIILDNSYRMLGSTRDMTEVGPSMKVIIDRGYALPQELRSFRKRNVVADLDSLESPEINKYINSLGETNYSIVHKFVASGRIMGYSIAYHCLSHPTDGYLYLMEMLAEKFQLYFEQIRQNDNYFAESYQTLLSGILGDSELTERQLRDQLGHIPDLSLEGNFMLGQLQYNRINDMSYSFISWSLRNSMPHFMPFVYRDNFYILKDNSRTKQHKNFITEEEETLFYKCFNHIDFACGISKPFYSLMDLKTAASQCREAISIGISAINSTDASSPVSSADSSSIAHVGKNSMFYYEDIAFYHMMQQLRKVMPLEMVESSQYRLLRKYEEQHGGDLSKVFLKYILNGCSVTKTAADTYMHRNTILNKVRKATEIMECDFEDFQKQLFYVISYMAEHSALLK